MSGQRKKSNSINMLQGPLLKNIILFAVPLALSSAFQQLFNSADSVFAGRFISSNALAGIGGVAPVISLFIALLTGLSVGVNVVIATHIGHGDEAKIPGAIRSVMVITLAGGVLFTICGLLLINPILIAISVPASAWDAAQQYLQVYFLGFLFFFIYNLGSAILRSKGDSKRPLYALAVGAVLNIPLSYATLVLLDAGVMGIAAATVFSNAVSAAIIVVILVREPAPYTLRLSNWKPVKSDVKRALYIGIPAGIQGGMFALSNIVVQGAINGFGSAAIAGSSAALNYEYYNFFFLNALVQAVVTFVGQNYAAHHYKRCDTIIKIGMVAGLIALMVVGWTFVLLGERALSVFTTDEATMPYGMARFHYVVALHWMIASYEITAAGMRGMGWSVLPAIITILGSCVLRIIYVVTIFPFVYSFENLLIIYPVSWVVTGSAMIVLFVFVRRRAYGISKIHNIHLNKRRRVAR